VSATREVLRTAARVVLVLAALLPFLPALVEGLPVLGKLGHALDAWFGYQCERDPSRMLGVGSVCARCVGIYVGLGLGALIARPRASSVRPLRAAVAAGLVLLLLDVGSELFGFRPAWAPLRVFSGLAFAYPVGLVAVHALARHPVGAEFATPTARRGPKCSRT